MNRVFVTQPIPEPGVSMLKRARFQVSVYPKDEIIPRQALLKGVKGVQAILCMLTNRIDDTVLRTAGKNLKIVANMAVGLDNVDLTACKKRKVIVTNTPGVLTDAVAEHTLVLMMTIARRIAEADRFTRLGKYNGWGPNLLLGSEIKGKTLGIVGLGRIGFGVAERAVRGMGMKVIYNDIKPNFDFEKQFGGQFRKLDQLLREADFVSLHLPLLPATRHLISARQFAIMKKTAYLINTSRGPIVDEKALVVALKNKKIAGAAIDVFEFEPELAPGLANLENVILTPHIASATIEARGAMARLAAENIIAVFEGRSPPSAVK